MADKLAFELVEAKIIKEPIGRVFRVTIDKPDPITEDLTLETPALLQNKITLDDCETYHRQLLPLVEHIDYDYLEVSSPGIDRPLKTERDFKKALGSSVEVHLYKPIDKTKKKGQNQKLRIGKLLSYTNECITIRDDEERVINIKDIALIRPYIDMSAYDNENKKAVREDNEE